MCKTPSSQHCQLFGSNSHYHIGRKPYKYTCPSHKIGMSCRYSAKPYRAASLIAPGRTKLDSVVIGIKTSVSWKSVDNSKTWCWLNASGNLEGPTVAILEAVAVHASGKPKRRPEHDSCIRSLTHNETKVQHTRGLPRPGGRNLYHLTDSRMPGSCSPCHHKGSRKLRKIKTRQQTARSGPCPGSCKHCHAVSDRKPWWFVTDEVVATAVSASAGPKPAASPARLANSVVSRGRHEISEAEIA